MVEDLENEVWKMISDNSDLITKRNKIYVSNLGRVKIVQYAAFCRGEIDEDDFENIWTGYTMADAGHWLRD